MEWNTMNVVKWVRDISMLLAFALAAGPVGAKTLEDVVAGVEGFYQDKESLQIAFTQVVKRKYSLSNEKGRTRAGVAFFQKPGKMRWDYRGDNPVYYISNGETLWVYEPAQNVAYRGQVKGNRLYGAMKFLFGTGNLKEDFNLELGTVTATEAELILKPKQSESAYQFIVLAVNPETFEIRRTVVVDPVGDRSEIVFEKIRYAPIDNPEWFDWKPDEGVRVEDLRARGRK
jgi:outer membrane lipoprotein carrier protein